MPRRSAYCRMALLWFSVEYCWCSVDILTYCAARIRGRPVSSPSWPRLPLSVNYPVLPHLGRGPAVVLSPRMSAEDGRRRSYGLRSEEHTSELQSLMRISYDGFCLKKKDKK